VVSASFVCSAVVAAIYLAVAGLPFFSESFTHLHVADGMEHWGQALDPSLEPLRPLQHLYFFVLASFDPPSPAWARLPGFVLHLGSCFLVAALARGFGATCSGALLAGALFALAPGVKNLVWVAAISAPGRVFFLLASLVAFQHYVARRNVAAGAACVLSFLIALGFHQSAVILPGLLLLLVWAKSGPATRERLGQARRWLSDPVVLSTCALGLAYFAYQAWFREQRYNQMKDLASLPANVVKASLAVAPELMRGSVVDGLRGGGGGAGFIGAGLLFVSWLALAVLIFWRGRAATRFAVAAIGLDAVLPTVMSGYDQRYSYLGLAFAACALGAWWGRRKVAREGLAACALAAVLLAIPAFDTLQDVLDYRQAGLVAETVIADAGTERARVGADTTIVLVDLPDVWGSESDLPMFNWGFPFAAERRGVDGPWVLLRTREFHTSSDSERVTSAEIERLVDRPGVSVLVFDRALGRLRRHDRIDAVE
jgi:hypothetical protein